MELRCRLPFGGCGTESDEVIRRGTSEGATAIVVGVAISPWARALEELRIGAWLACLRGAVSAAATIPWIPKCLARALARHALLATTLSFRRHFHLQLPRAPSVQVRHATRRRAVSSTAIGRL